MDWYSPTYLPGPSGEGSNALNVAYCLKALEAALGEHKPEVFNSN
jgi:hypothetical protein